MSSESPPEGFAESDLPPIGAGARVVLVGKPGCHLCDTARDVVRSVSEELGVEWREVSILHDVQLAERYAEQIPVVFVDGRPHDYWRVDSRRLRRTLSRRRWWRRR
ncbi:MAG TPA: glutaredoxin family protein [Kineosporiaceae bacterium]